MFLQIIRVVLLRLEIFMGRYFTLLRTVIIDILATETELPELVNLFMTELLKTKKHTAQNMKFSIRDFFSKCDQILNGKLHFLRSSDTGLAEVKRLLQSISYWQ